MESAMLHNLIYTVAQNIQTKHCLYRGQRRTDGKSMKNRNVFNPCKKGFCKDGVNLLVITTYFGVFLCPTVQSVPCLLPDKQL